MQSLWIDGCYSPSWICELSRKAACTQDAKTEIDRAFPFDDSSAALIASLRACAKHRDLFRGSRIHNDILTKGLLEKCSDALLTMYAKCGALKTAQELLDMHNSRDIISWTALIAGYVRQGQCFNALKCFEQMRHAGISPDAVTYTCLLKACARSTAMEKGMLIHDEILKQGLLGGNIILGNALVDMYVKCGALEKAEDVLEELPSRDVISWSTLIIGYAEHGQGKQALQCFDRMQCEGILPNAVTFIGILKSCGIMGAIEKGKQIHDEIARQGLLRNDTVLGTALVDMYAKCSAIEKAAHVLENLPSRSVVTWNALITGCVQHGQGKQALCYFEWMQLEGIFPNAVTFMCAFKACGIMKAADKGKRIYDEVLKQGLLREHVALGSAVVDMYVKCGDLASAQSAHEELPVRDVVSWSALIAGFVQEGLGQQALDCFEQMQHEGLMANAVTFSSILKACGIAGALDKGGHIHNEIVEQGLVGKDIVLDNSLVDMYAKCGALVKAQRVLEELPVRNTMTWNVLIAGFTKHDQGEHALVLFEQMLCDGCPPDAVTLSCVLSACSHLGLVEESYTYFKTVTTKYGVTPALEHYTCMVDLFGRAGHLAKAAEVIQGMQSCDHSVLWRALLNACQKWGDLDVGKWAFQQALQLDEADGAVYVLMASIYAAAGRKEDAREIESMLVRVKEGAIHSGEHNKDIICMAGC